jgi:uncharacterized membrane protein
VSSSLQETLKERPNFAMIYFLLKFLHILGATVLLGTGTGIAFFMLMAHRTGDADFIARTARIVVIADALFTATAVVAQPITGYLLVRELGLSLGEPWIVISLALYFFAGAFWLPVVWMQARLRDLATAAARDNAPLPDAYRRLFRLWFARGRSLGLRPRARPNFSRYRKRAFGNIALDPTHDRRMRQGDSGFGHHLDEVSKAELVAQMPADAEDDDFVVERRRRSASVPFSACTARRTAPRCCATSGGLRRGRIS